jgi:UDP-N-acetylglucosamine acyltransferase
VSRVHPTAIVAPEASLGEGVEIGPFAIVGPRVVVGDGCRIGPHATLEQNTRLGPGTSVGQGSVLGGDPQDLKYRREETWLEIGAGTVVREYATINRGTAATGLTRLGERCVVMAYVHVAHDCRIGDRVILVNGTQVAGHVAIHDAATVSGLVAVHQFVTIGTHAFVGGCSRVNQDIPPFVTAAGNPVELYGLNLVGLERAGFTRDVIHTLKRVYRLFFNSELSRAEAADRARRELPPLPEVEQFIEFVMRAPRGVPA